MLNMAILRSLCLGGFFGFSRLGAYKVNAYDDDVQRTRFSHNTEKALMKLRGRNSVDLLS